MRTEDEGPVPRNPHAARRLRVGFEVVLALITGSLAIVTTFWGEWIEWLFDVDPDHGDGSAEWLIVGALALTSLVLALLARLEWRRLAAD